MSQSKYILPNPFHFGPYGVQDPSHAAWKRIIETAGANPNANEINKGGILQTHTTILDPITFTQYPDTRPEIGGFFDTCLDMQQSCISRMKADWNFDGALSIIGGDHSISIGTGAGLAQMVDMSKVGLLYIDTHGDCNTPEVSRSKSITGYPAAVVRGFGHEEMLQPFNGNFIKDMAYIGIRDIDDIELDLYHTMTPCRYSILDVVEKGIATCLERALDHLSHCEYIWLSIDIDSLDSVYFSKDETDEMCPAGLTPRELLYIVHKVYQTNKLKITEITQINETGELSPIVILGSRIVEHSLGLGYFRYGL